jgi:hypothetical protein
MLSEQYKLRFEPQVPPTLKCYKTFRRFKCIRHKRNQPDLSLRSWLICCERCHVFAGKFSTSPGYFGEPAFGFVLEALGFGFAVAAGLGVTFLTIGGAGGAEPEILIEILPDLGLEAQSAG